MKKIVGSVLISLFLLAHVSLAQKIQEQELVGKWSLTQKEWKGSSHIERIAPESAGHTTLILAADKTCQLVYAQNPNEYKGTWQFDKSKNQIVMQLGSYDYILKIRQKIGNTLIINLEDGDVLYGYDHYEKVN